MSAKGHDRVQDRLRAGIAVPSRESWARLNAALVERAAEEGLVDVAYTVVDSPLGRLIVAGTQAGIVKLAFDNESRDAVLDQLATRLSPRVLEAPTRLDTARRQLDEYFLGERTRFDLSVDWALAKGFRREVLVATAR
ncbi:MAG: cysteine methyltransferase, partial [Actinobacteria bacterium]|nr:cysteine methyltransferase [Actinomycetota bacterium]